MLIHVVRNSGRTTPLMTSMPSGVYCSCFLSAGHAHCVGVSSTVNDNVERTEMTCIVKG